MKKNITLITLALIGLSLMYRCKKESPAAPAPTTTTIAVIPTPTVTATYAIGQHYGGGVIFYIDVTGQHGLVAATNDLPNFYDWGCEGTFVSGAHGTAVGTGQANTTAIIVGCSTPGIAARACDDLVLNGYSDWYLPSKDELKLAFDHSTEIGGFILDQDLLYWSSSEWDSNWAWNVDASNGNVTMAYDNNTKETTSSKVRPIRSF